MTFAIVTTLIIVLVASARYLTYALVGYLVVFLEERRNLAALKKVHGDAPIDFGCSHCPKTDSLASVSLRRLLALKRGCPISKQRGFAGRGGIRRLQSFLHGHRDRLLSGLFSSHPYPREA